MVRSHPLCPLSYGRSGHCMGRLQQSPRTASNDSLVSDVGLADGGTESEQSRSEERIGGLGGADGRRMHFAIAICDAERYPTRVVHCVRLARASCGPNLDRYRRDGHAALAS